MNEKMKRFCEWLSWKLPRHLVYFAAIRLIVNATTGKYSWESTPGVTAIDALKRWEDEK
jgi:hypothetical protein